MFLQQQQNITIYVCVCLYKHKYIYIYKTDSDFCFIEWPEKAINLIPAEALNIEIEILGPEHRRIFIP